jgi:hypothetical protein
MVLGLMKVREELPSDAMRLAPLVVRPQPSLSGGRKVPSGVRLVLAE